MHQIYKICPKMYVANMHFFLVLSLFNSISGPFGVILVHHSSFSAIFNFFSTLLTSANSDQFRTFLMLHSVSKKKISKRKNSIGSISNPKNKIFSHLTVFFLVSVHLPIPMPPFCCLAGLTCNLKVTGALHPCAISQKKI